MSTWTALEPVEGGVEIDDPNTLSSQDKRFMLRAIGVGIALLALVIVLGTFPLWVSS